MSASNEWTNWCLTKDGWKSGKERKDFTGISGEDIKESLLIIRYSCFFGSMHSEPSISSDEIFRNAPQEEIDFLIKKYGPAPKEL